MILETIFAQKTRFDLGMTADDNQAVVLLDDNGKGYVPGDCWQFAGFVDGIYLKESKYVYADNVEKYSEPTLNAIIQEFFDNQSLSRLEQFVSTGSMRAYHLNKTIRTQLAPIEDIALDYGISIDHNFSLTQQSDADIYIAQDNPTFENLVNRAAAFMEEYGSGFENGAEPMEIINELGERIDLRDNIRKFYQTNKMVPGFEYYDILMATDESIS